MDNKMPLAALRVRAGYNQTDAAEAVGVSKTTLAKWEQNSLSAPMFYIEKFVDLYQMPKEDIYFGHADDLSADIRRAYERSGNPPTTPANA